CSGLAMMAYRATGITIPRTSQAQWNWGRQIPASQAQPGDLVFFAGSDGTPAAPGHVGIVLDPAAHTMINAYATGYTVAEDTYRPRASKEGLSPVVGFTRPLQVLANDVLSSKDLPGGLPGLPQRRDHYGEVVLQVVGTTVPIPIRRERLDELAEDHQHCRS